MNGVGGSSWTSVVTQYTSTSQGAITNPTGQFKGAWSDTTALPSKLTQTNIASAAVRCMTHFGYNVNANYIVATPSGKSMSGFGTQWCAWHSSTTSGSGNVTQKTETNREVTETNGEVGDNLH